MSEEPQAKRYGTRVGDEECEHGKEEKEVFVYLSVSLFVWLQVRFLLYLSLWRRNHTRNLTLINHSIIVRTFSKI